MKRSTPLRRTGFGRPAQPKRAPAPLVPVRGGLRGVYAPPGEVVLGAPKRVPVRSKALLEACREIPCQICFVMDGTVVSAHSNQLAHGKARGQKADDNRVASLCHRCHSDLDQGSRMSGEERRSMWDEAHVRTVLVLIGAGLWPAGVPVPETGCHTVEGASARRASVEEPAPAPIAAKERSR